ncbi:MAG: DNA polymerase II [Desulfurococcales archaeon]|nr:DNA polymerase II [Desulfurococcales archaeon]
MDGVEAIAFQLLDITYEVEGGQPVLILYGRTDDEKRIVVRYKGFRPYFYALPEEGYTVDDIRRIAPRLSKPGSPILSVEEVDKRYIGRQVKAARIVTLIPAKVREYREAFAKLDAVREVLEADIRFSLRFLIDMNLYPMRWYRIKASRKSGTGPYRVEAVYEANNEKIEELAEYAGEDPLKGLRVMAFDIEVYNRTGSPDPRRDPVIIIGYATNENPEPELLVMEGKIDTDVILKFVQKVREYDPDIIVGYNQNNFDWPYLIERSRVLGVALDVGRKRGGIPQTSVYGHISVPGRLNVDLYDFAKEIHEIKVKTLEEVADYLDVLPKEKRVILDWWEIPEYWESPGKRPVLFQYAKDDVRATIGLADKFLPFGAQMSQISGLPMDQVMAASVGFRLEWRLIREAYKLNELAPNRVERGEESYTGAIVLKPKKGIHDNIAVLDFASMYPNIMIKYNVGPDTLVRPGEEVSDDEVYVAVGVGHKFRKKPDGFFKKVLMKFLKIRKMIKEEMKKYPSDTSLYKLLDERQRAVKVLANATYGYMGWTAARWYCKPCAESVTAWGRAIITQAIKKARSLGLDVIYGDTDSLFVKYIPDKVQELIKYVEEELGFEIKIDKIYKKVFFTEAKKRYVGLTIDDKIDVVGFEAVRGDWSELAKETQLAVIELILKKGSIDEAVNHVRSVIEKLKSGQVDLKKLIIWKTLTRRPEEYQVEQPHVYAAKLMEKAGIKIRPGMMIGYIIVKGSGPLARKARPYFMVKPQDVDVNYYIEKQVIPAAMRILGYFGVKESMLKSGRRQKTLFDFMSG